jgi:glycosyltransferase involved in cell wall biosynthesis
MIVNDDARLLGRCLQTARPHVDEIVVVDTGSSDETAAIAGRYGARVEQFAWSDDFAAARNHTLSLATGDWVLVLDGDEILEAPTGELRRLLERLPLPELTGVMPVVSFVLCNHVRSIAAGDPREATSARRLFPRGCLRYVGAGHETPIPPDGSTHQLVPYQGSRIEVHHFG